MNYYCGTCKTDQISHFMLCKECKKSFECPWCHQPASAYKAPEGQTIWQQEAYTDEEDETPEYYRAKERENQSTARGSQDPAPVDVSSSTKREKCVECGKETTKPFWTTLIVPRTIMSLRPCCSMNCLHIYCEQKTGMTGQTKECTCKCGCKERR